MQVARVISPVSSRESWTVLGEDDAPVEPIERYLAYLTDIERSPNTVKAYAHDLKDWFVFLTNRGLDWRGGAARGCGRVRRLAAAAAAGSRRTGRGVAVGGASLHGIHCESQAFGGRRVLYPRRSRRRRGGRVVDVPVLVSNAMTEGTLLVLDRNSVLSVYGDVQIATSTDYFFGGGLSRPQ